MTTARATAEARNSVAPLWPLALAIAVRIAAWLMVSPTRLASDEDSYFAVASGLLASRSQDIFWPPITGWLIAAIRWTLQTDTITTVRLVWVALDLGCLLAVRTLALRLGRALFADDDVKAARLSLLATLGYALYLPAISHAQFATSETPALLQTLAVLLLLTKASAFRLPVAGCPPTRPEAATARPRRSSQQTQRAEAGRLPVAGRVGTATYACAGALTGTLALTRPSLLPLLALWPLATWRNQPSADVWRRVAVFVTTGAVVVGAWVLRNWQVDGQLTIANNSAYNLFIGNRDLYAEDLDLFSPVATREQVEFRRQQWSGQLVYPADPPPELQRQAFAWIAAHPLTFARRAVGRLARVFAPKTDVLELAGGEQLAGAFSPISLVLLSAANAQWTVVLFGGLIGLAAIARIAPDFGRVFVATIAGSVLLCTVAISKPRYSFVFDPLLVIGLAALLTAPYQMTAALDAGSRRILAVLMAFLLWGWVAWLIFAFSSRMAL